jgi:hypothetical protein
MLTTLSLSTTETTGKTGTDWQYASNSQLTYIFIWIALLLFIVIKYIPRCMNIEDYRKKLNKDRVFTKVENIYS